MKSYFSFITLFFSIIFLSCDSKNSEQDKFTALSDSTSITKLKGDSVKLVKTGTIHFKVHDVAQSARAISAITRKFGGVTCNQTLQSVEIGTNELKLSADSSMIITSYAPQADISVRIPSENLEEFLYAVDDLGYFTGNINLHVDDKSLQYLENVLKQKNRIAVSQEPGIKMKNALTSLQAIEVNDEISRQQISNMAVNADVSYSPVNLSLFQNPVVRKEIIANTAISDYQLPFGKRLNNAIKDGWQYFLNIVLILANLWMFILAGIAVVVIYRYVYPKKSLPVRV